MSSCPASTVDAAVVPVLVVAYYTGLEERWQPRGAAVLEQPAVASFAAAAAVAFRCISFHFQLPP